MFGGFRQLFRLCKDMPECRKALLYIMLISLLFGLALSIFTFFIIFGFYEWVSMPISGNAPQGLSTLGESVFHFFNLASNISGFIVKALLFFLFIGLTPAFLILAYISGINILAMPWLSRISACSGGVNISFPEGMKRASLMRLAFIWLEAFGWILVCIVCTGLFLVAAQKINGAFLYTFYGLIAIYACSKLFVLSAMIPVALIYDLSIGECRREWKESRLRYFGCGITGVILTLIPIVNLVVFPAACLAIQSRIRHSAPLMHSENPDLSNKE